MGRQGLDDRLRGDVLTPASTGNAPVAGHVSRGSHGPLELVLDIGCHTLSAPGQSNQDRGLESRRADIHLDCVGGIARSPHMTGRYRYRESEEWDLKSHRTA